ncbi:MAG: hypothetical protein J3R72DRAFT_246519 [Linnemannia gamsii]|nr:MAG: hypothetical protein J3R72DRAFT_246519 [Linnemannia gamsii]
MLMPQVITVRITIFTLSLFFFFFLLNLHSRFTPYSGTIVHRPLSFFIPTHSRASFTLSSLSKSHLSVQGNISSRTLKIEAKEAGRAEGIRNWKTQEQLKGTTNMDNASFFNLSTTPALPLLQGAGLLLLIRSGFTRSRGMEKHHASSHKTGCSDQPPP